MINICHNEYKDSEFNGECNDQYEQNMRLIKKTKVALHKQGNEINHILSSLTEHFDH